MKKTSSRRSLWLVMQIALAVGPQVRVAFAQNASAVDVAQARQLFNQGLTLREKGDPAGAVEKFKAAHALAHTPLTGLELGRTYALLKQLVEAREAFLSVARIPLMSEETVRAKTARIESALLAEQLRPRIPSLTVRITGVPADSVAVTIDGANVPTEALAAPRLVDPGSHNVFARSTSGGTAETKVELGEGDSRDVELKIVFTGGGQTPPTQTTDTGRREPAPFSPSDTSNGQSSTTRSRVLEWSLMGGGAAVGAAGAVLMILEAGKAADANGAHDKNAYDSASTAWTVGLVGSLVGAAAFLGGGVVFVTSNGGEGPRTSGSSLWVRLGANDVRVGGTW